MLRGLLILTLAMVSGFALAQDEAASKKLSLEEVLKQSVERNLDIKLERYNVESSAISLDLTRAAYEPTVNGSSSFQSYDSEPSNIFEGNADETITNETTNANLGISKSEDFGLSWSVDLSNRYSDTSSQFTFPESYSSTLVLGVEQKLLQGFSLDPEIRRKNEFLARGNLAISKLDLSLRISEVIQATEDAYWDLVQSIQQLKVAQNSLNLAKQLHDQNKIKIEVGTLAPIELVSAEATVASREAAIVNAENAVRAAEDRLKRILNMEADMWPVRLIPADEPEFIPIDRNLEQDFTDALNQRVELKMDHIQMENAMLELKTRNNELLPQLSLRGAYFLRGTSNTQIDPNTGAIISDPAYSDVLSEIRDRDLPGYEVSLNLSWSPFNKVAKLNKAAAEVSIRRQETLSEQLRIDILQEVRSAVRELDASANSIRANEKARKFREENLRAEVQKFQNGLSTNFEVAQVQDELTQAISDEIQARIAYRKALVAYFKAIGDLLEARNIHID